MLPTGNFAVLLHVDAMRTALYLRIESLTHSRSFQPGSPPIFRNSFGNKRFSAFSTSSVPVTPSSSRPVHYPGQTPREHHPGLARPYQASPKDQNYGLTSHKHDLARSRTVPAHSLSTLAPTSSSRLNAHNCQISSTQGPVHLTKLRPAQASARRAYRQPISAPRTCLYIPPYISTTRLSHLRPATRPFALNSASLHRIRSLPTHVSKLPNLVRRPKRCFFWLDNAIAPPIGCFKTARDSLHSGVGLPISCGIWPPSRL